MASKELTLVLKAKDLASKQIGKVGDKLDGVSKRSKIARAGLIGFAAGIGIVLTAAGLFISKIDDMVRAALDEEVSIARLDAALKANVKNWDGNRDAIERVLEKRTELAFSDDELRESLGTIVTATGNVSKALDVQAVAMDLARLKGISLTDASKILTSALSGNRKGLKDIGIELPKTASDMEVLAAVQKKAAGQAKAFGDTNQGAFDKVGVAVGELMEDFGQLLLPGMKKVANWIVSDFIPAMRRLAAAFGWLIDRARDLFDWLGGVLNRLASIARMDPGTPPSLGGVGGKVQQRAVGGAAHGMTLVGERGPELVNLRGRGFITPNHKLPGGGGQQVIVLQISGQEVGRVVVPEVSRRMFYELQRAAPTLSRT